MRALGSPARLPAPARLGRKRTAGSRSARFQLRPRRSTTSGSSTTRGTATSMSSRPITSPPSCCWRTTGADRSRTPLTAAQLNQTPAFPGWEDKAQPPDFATPGLYIYRGNGVVLTAVGEGQAVTGELRFLTPVKARDGSGARVTMARGGGGRRVASFSMAGYLTVRLDTKSAALPVEVTIDSAVLAVAGLRRAAQDHPHLASVHALRARPPRYGVGRLQRRRASRRVHHPGRGVRKDRAIQGGRPG